MIENLTELDAGNDSREYKVEAIWNSTIYARELELGHLQSLYYLVSWKRYSKEENTLKLTLAMQHFQKLISPFYKNHPNKPITTSLAIGIASPIARKIT